MGYASRRCSFNPCFDGSVARGRGVCFGNWQICCFNPCFDGSVARGRNWLKVLTTCIGFNPCFDGSVARGREAEAGSQWFVGFQSLF